jgi:hypothetical protein
MTQWILSDVSCEERTQRILSFMSCLWTRTHGAGTSTAINTIHGRPSRHTTRIDTLHLSDLLIEPVRPPFRASTFTATHEYESFANASLDMRSLHLTATLNTSPPGPRSLHSTHGAGTFTAILNTIHGRASLRTTRIDIHFSYPDLLIEPVRHPL